MTRRLLVLLCALPVALAACSSDSDSKSDDSGSGPAANTIEVTLSDSGCAPRAITAPAGATRFHVTNSGTSAVTEFEILQGQKVLGEVESVIPGKDRSFTLTLKAGNYTTKCPGGSSFEEGTLTVSG